MFVIIVGLSSGMRLWMFLVCVGWGGVDFGGVELMMGFVFVCGVFGGFELEG